MERELYYTDERGVNYIYKLGPLASEPLTLFGYPIQTESFYPDGLTMTLRPQIFETSHYQAKAMIIKGRRLDDLIIFADAERLPYADTHGISYGLCQPRIDGLELQLWLSRLDHWFGYYEPLTTVVV